MKLILTAFVALVFCTGALSQTPLSPNSSDVVAPAHVVDTSIVPVPEPSAQAWAYHNGNTILWIVDILLGIAIPLLFLFTGFSAKLRDLARIIVKKQFLTIGFYFPM